MDELEWDRFFGYCETFARRHRIAKGEPEAEDLTDEGIKEMEKREKLLYYGMLLGLTPKGR